MMGHTITSMDAMLKERYMGPYLDKVAGFNEPPGPHYGPPWPSAAKWVAMAQASGVVAPEGLAAVLEEARQARSAAAAYDDPHCGGGQHIPDWYWSMQRR